jgi:hypothetical protein
MKFKNPFAKEKKKQVLPPSGPNAAFIPVEIEEEASDFFEAMGITDERKGEIIAHSLASYMSTSNLVSAIRKATEQAGASHANELVAITFIISKHHHAASNPLLSLLSGRDENN